VWVFVSILTGARVGGLLGVIVAVPTAVVIKSALTVLRSPQGAEILSPLSPLTPLEPSNDTVAERSAGPDRRNLPAAQGES
jgi:hypothetical protein